MQDESPPALLAAVIAGDSAAVVRARSTRVMCRPATGPWPSCGLFLASPVPAVCWSVVAAAGPCPRGASSDAAGMPDHSRLELLLPLADFSLEPEFNPDVIWFSSVTSALPGTMRVPRQPAGCSTCFFTEPHRCTDRCRRARRRRTVVRWRPEDATATGDRVRATEQGQDD